MTIDQLNMVDSLRRQGKGYKQIAGILGISENTVKSYLRRNPLVIEPVNVIKKTETSIVKHNCLQCGAPVRQNPGRKEKKFCSDACRNAWWNSHLNEVKRKAIYHYICPACGKQFAVYGKKNRKYCSHNCYISDRFGGMYTDDQTGISQ